jgi:uncharacterized protein YjiS (DUF1127 family)
MTRLYFATVIAAAVTTSLASHILVVRASGSTTARLRAGLRPTVRALLGRAKSLIDDWIVAMLAHREHQVARLVLHRLSDRELKDIGLYRGNIGDIGRRSERQRQDRIGDHRSAPRAIDEVAR